MKKLLFLVCFFGSLPLKANDPYVIKEFGGLNTEISPINLKSGDSADSQNVITDVSPELFGRQGFIIFSTQPAVDFWEFPLSNGTRYFIKRSSNTLLADTGTGTFGTLVSTIPLNVATVGSTLGDKFYFGNTTDGLKYWTGTTVVVASASLTINLLVTAKGRLWASGKAGSERVIFVSKLYDGTSWTTPTNPSDDDPTQITVTGALDENIQALFPSFRGITIIWFKKNSFGGIYGSRRSNFAQQSFSEFVGAASPDSIRDCDGKLRWLANNRMVYEFDGAIFHKISDPINTLINTILQGDSNGRTNTQTTQTDFGAGTISSPSNGLSTSISPGSVVLSTMAQSSQVDTSSADFAAGTLTTLSTTVINGSLTLPYGAEILIQSGSQPVESGSFCSSPDYGYITFSNSAGFILDEIRITVQRVGNPGDFSPRIRDNSNNLLGNLDTITASGVTTNPAGTLETVTTTSNDVIISPSVTYRIQLHPIGTCNVDPGPPVINDYLKFVTGGLFELHGHQYSASGTLVSRVFDVTVTTNTWLYNWGPFTVNGSTNGQTATYQTQTSSSATGTFTSLASVVSGSTPTSTVQEFIRYKASLSTTDQSTTPVINDITLTAGPFQKSSGTFTTQIVNVGGNITSWGALTIDDAKNNGTIGYFFNRSTNSNISLFDSSSWTAITTGNIPTLSVGPYAALRATFTITNSTWAPTLNDVTFAWNEGSSIRTASQWFNQRYWLSVAISSSANNTVLVYDRREQWQKYVGINADTLGLYVSRLMFANSGGIFQAETGYSDNGNPISSYYTAGTLDLGSANLWDSFRTLYLTTDNSDSAIATTYQLNGIGTDYSLGSSAMNITSGTQDLKFPFYMNEAQQGKVIALKWTVSGTTFWRLIRASLYYLSGQEPD